MLPLAIITIGLLALATVCDLRGREIPDSISLLLLVCGLVAAACGWTSMPLIQALIGIGIGLAVTAPLFYLGGIGGGDVKLVAALGAVLGPIGLLLALFWMAIGGGVLALVAKLRGHSDFAYVPAILFGVCVVFLRQQVMP